MSSATCPFYRGGHGSQGGGRGQGTGQRPLGAFGTPGARGSGMAVKTVTLDPSTGLRHDPSPSPEPTYPGKAGLYSFHLMTHPPPVLWQWSQQCQRVEAFESHPGVPPGGSRQLCSAARPLFRASAWPGQKLAA